jgi:Ca2+/Na+ antiporter
LLEVSTAKAVRQPPDATEHFLIASFTLHFLCPVTFVAMGNGAPDLSANITAIRNGQVSQVWISRFHICAKARLGVHDVILDAWQVQLSSGAFTGAAMFVQCIVASEVGCADCDKMQGANDA